jgi:hypothetical protein
MPVRSFRLGIVLVGLLLVSVVAAPSVGGFNDPKTTGTTGEYTVNDYNGTPGVSCRFADQAGVNRDLVNRIRVAKNWSHGPYARKSWVGYRYIITRNTPPYDDATFSVAYRSPIVKQRANQTEVAFFGPFAWTPPAGAKAHYQVRLVFIYYAPGSKTKVVGRVRGALEVYRHRLSAGNTYDLGSEGDAGWCRRNYHFEN